MRVSEDEEVRAWTGEYIRQSWEGRIAPTPPTQILFARPLIGDGETPDQLDDGSGQKLDLVFGWESKYFFSHDALAFMKALDLPDARFYDNGDEIQLLDYNGPKITEPAPLFLPAVLKDSLINDSLTEVAEIAREPTDVLDLSSCRSATIQVPDRAGGGDERDELMVELGVYELARKAEEQKVVAPIERVRASELAATLSPAPSNGDDMTDGYDDCGILLVPMPLDDAAEGPDELTPHAPLQAVEIAPDPPSVFSVVSEMSLSSAVNEARAKGATPNY